MTSPNQDINHANAVLALYGLSRSGKSRQCDEAARYVAKYLGKAPHQFGTFKRYWKSAGWVVSTGEEVEDPWDGTGWEAVKEHPDDVIRDLICKGWWRVPGEFSPHTIRLLCPVWDEARQRAPPAGGW